MTLVESLYKSNRLPIHSSLFLCYDESGLHRPAMSEGPKHEREEIRGNKAGSYMEPRYFSQSMYSIIKIGSSL